VVVMGVVVGVVVMMVVVLVLLLLLLLLLLVVVVVGSSVYEVRGVTVTSSFAEEMESLPVTIIWISRYKIVCVRVCMCMCA